LRERALTGAIPEPMAPRPIHPTLGRGTLVADMFANVLSPGMDERNRQRRIAMLYSSTAYIEQLAGPGPVVFRL
jgi:hypothetical protein